MAQWRREEVAVAGLESGVAGLCPASGDDRPRWYVATCDGRLKGIDLDDGSTFFELKLPFGFDKPGSAELVASADGRYVAVVPRVGLKGLLHDVLEARSTPIQRSDYHADVSGWALAILRKGERDVLVHATAWNRLEAWALPGCERLAPNSEESELDYFWGTLAVSPGGSRLASFGWVWQPVGVVRVVNVDQWLETREDPPPGPEGGVGAEWWDEPVCWLGESRLALVGQEPRVDDSFFTKQTGLAIVDAESGDLERFVPGIEAAAFGFDGERLFALGEMTRVIEVATGAVVASLEAPVDAWHPGARVLLSCPPVRGQQGPCVMHWLSGTVTGLGQGQVTVPAAAALAVLGDALEERGLERAAVAHCRGGGAHGRRCWVIEAVRPDD